MAFLDKPRHLLAAWGAYWAGLAAVTLGPGLLRVAQAVRGPENTSSVSAGYGDGRFTATIVEHGVTTWQASAAAMPVFLAIAGPPLALFVVWLLRRPRRDAVSSAVASLDAARAAQAIGAGPYEAPPRARDAEPVERRPDAR